MDGMSSEPERVRDKSFPFVWVEGTSHPSARHCSKIPRKI